MKALVTATIYENNNLSGYVIVFFGETSTQKKSMTLESLRFLCERQNIEFLNAEYDKKLRILGGTMGALLNYPRINTDLKLITKQGITIAATILDKDTKKPVGCVAYNAYGVRNNLTYKKMMELARTCIETNYEFKNTKEYGTIAVPKEGKQIPTIEMQVNNKPKAYRSSAGEVAPEVQKTKVITPVDGLPFIEVYSFDEVKTSEYSRSAQEVMIKAKINLKKLSPYYYTIFESLKMKPVVGLGTMGVTEDTLVFDYEFVSQLDIPTLTYLMIHEVSHVAMLHPLRRGKRDPKLFNIATDLYINTIINNDFGISVGSGIKYFNKGTANEACIKTPEIGGVFLETIGETLDLTRDTPEKIYERLKKENQQQQNQQQSGGQGQSGQQQSSSQSNNGSEQQRETGIQNLQEGSEALKQEVSKGGNSQADQKAQEGQNDINDGIQKVQDALQSGDTDKLKEGLQQIADGIDKMNEAKNESGQGNNQQANDASQQMENGLNQMLESMINDKQNQQGQGQQGQGQQGQGKGQGQGSDGSQSGQGSQGQIGQGSGDNSFDGKDPSQGQESLDDITQGDKEGKIEMQKVSVTYNGKKLEGSIMSDLMSNHDAKQQEADMDARLEEARSALQRMKTKVKMWEEQHEGQKCTKAGTGGELAERYIDFGLSQGVDWRVLLANVCKRVPKKAYTLGDPNRDYMNMGMTIAGRRKVGHSKEVSDIKICIDVSGSVGKADLEWYMSEIANIFNYFKVTGELIYWSTEVGDVGDFRELKDMLKVKPFTTGGTDVKCVFDYLVGKTLINGKPEPTKARDISCVIFITDGYFSSNYGMYEEWFGNKTIWIIDGNPVMFKPCFGRVVGLERK